MSTSFLLAVFGKLPIDDADPATLDAISVALAHEAGGVLSSRICPIGAS